MIWFSFFLMPLIPSENNLYMCPSLNLMLEIMPGLYLDLILNCSYVLSLTLEMRLSCLLIDIFCSFLPCVLLCFCLFSIPFPTRCSNPCLCIRVYVGGMTEVLIWGIRCAAITVFSRVFLVVLFLCLYGSYCSLPSSGRFCVSG